MSEPTNLWTVMRGHPLYKPACGLSVTYLVFALVLFPFFYFASTIDGTEIEGTWDRLGRSIYFSVVTITTTGYGHIKPTTPYARVLACIEILTGFILIVFVLPVLFAVYADKEISVTIEPTEPPEPELPAAEA